MEQAAAGFHWIGGPVACLLLHGFTATPEEMRFLGSRLHDAGHSVLGVRLAGHGTSPEDLEATRWQDWLDSASQGLRRVRDRAEHVVVVGQSMGGLLGLRLAAHSPNDIDTLVLLAPALRLTRPWLQWIRPALPLVALYRRFLDKGESDISDAEARATRAQISQVPVRSLHQFLLLQSAVRRDLPRVHQPALILQSRQDHTCHPAGVDLLRRTLSGPTEIGFFEESFHVLSVDVDREQVAQRILDFIRSRYAVPRPNQPQRPPSHRR